jgi:hypothetical protein
VVNLTFPSLPYIFFPHFSFSLFYIIRFVIFHINAQVLERRLRFMRKEMGLTLIDDPLFPTKTLKSSFVKGAIRR